MPEHPIGFIIYETSIPIVTATLPDMVETLQTRGVYAADFPIHPLYRSTRTMQQGVPITIYAERDGNGGDAPTWNWRETASIKDRALSHYYTPTIDMVQELTNRFPEHFFVYTVEDMHEKGIFCRVVDQHAIALEVGMRLAQIFPHHDIMVDQMRGVRVTYRIAVARRLA